MRVVIGEDEALLRDGLALVLTDAGVEVAAAAADAPELIALAARHEPDLVIADIRMPPHNVDDGLRAALEIRAARPRTAIVILSQHVNRQYARQLTENGTARVGYLLKQRVADTATFVRDLVRVAGGGTALDPEVVDVMLARAQHRDNAIAQLTPPPDRGALARRAGTQQRLDRPAARDYREGRHPARLPRLRTARTRPQRRRPPPRTRRHSISHAVIHDRLEAAYAWPVGRTVSAVGLRAGIVAGSDGRGP